MLRWPVPISRSARVSGGRPWTSARRSYCGEDWASITNLACLTRRRALAQLTLGISNVVFHLPLPVAVAHNAGAALLLLTLVAINLMLWRLPARKPHATHLQGGVQCPP